MGDNKDKAALFQPEGEEDSTDSSSSSSVLPQSVFNFGWHSLHAAQRARFATEVESAGKPIRKKRAYDNSSRSAQAFYERANKADAHRKNGLSEERLSKLFANDRCLCYWPVQSNCLSEIH